MATIAEKTSTTSRRDFDVEVSSRSLGYNLPQRVGRLLVLPMWAMAIMAFPGALVVGSVRSAKIHNGTATPDTLATLQHVTAGLMFLGFAAVFAAISFAIARILGQFRKGGGDVQEATGRGVQTLKMPLTAKAFLGLMMMAMMTLLVAVVLHFVFATQVHNNPASLKLAEDRFVLLEGIRRIGVAMYLFAIILGLGAIIHVLRFQAVRIRELAREARRG
jgi:hypothetical protein